jgi:hypothetical protein
MPIMYGCPSDTYLAPGETGYQVILGPMSAFTPDFRPLKLADFTDGIDRTLAVGETTRAVPWTKPEDLSIEGPAPFHGLGSRHDPERTGSVALFIDGSVRFLKASKIAPKVLDALLTRNGGEAIPADSY